LTRIKQRPDDKKILQVVKNNKILLENTRVPNIYKSKVRRSKKRTFIYPNGESFRVVYRFDNHYNFLDKFDILYSTSANMTNQSFDFDFANSCSDVVVYSKEQFEQKNSSKIFKITNKKIQKIR